MSYSISVPRMALAGWLALLLAACSGLPPESAHVRDNSSAVGSVRATLRPEALIRNAESRGGIQVGYERYRGNGRQDISTGQSIYLSGSAISISGPDTLQNEATVTQTHLAYTQTLLFGPNFELEPMLGMSHLGVDFKMVPTVSALRPSQHFGATRFYGGITPRWRFNDWVAIEARFAGSAGPDFQAGNSDLGVVLRPDKRVALRLGYSWRSVQGNFDLLSSDIHIDVRGPSASLVFDF